MANIEFKTLKQFMPYWCQKILPAVYDDSLSYYQLLGRILQKYNEVIEIVNKHSETLVDHENRITLTEQQIATLTKKVEELDAQVKQNTANIVALTERVNAHDTQIEALENWLNSFKSFGGERYATINETTHELKLFMGLTSSALAFAKWKSAIDTASAQDFVVVGGGNSVGQILLHSKSASSFSAFGFLIEDGDLHFFRATYSTQGSAADTGATTDWREVELLDITNIKQALGNGEYDTISQKVLTQLINSKLNHDMGITGATAGQYINIAEVDDDGKPLTYGFGTPGGGGSGVDIVQTTGQSPTSVMSQQATTNAINAVKPNANAGATAANQLAASVVYPTTVGGTNGKFVDKNGATLTRAQLLGALISADGKNALFTVKKTGSTSWDRITWFKASAGEGLYDFAWYETDGTNAKAGVDRLTMATNGQFAVSEQSSTSFGQDAPGSLIAGEFRLNEGSLHLRTDSVPNVQAGINGGELRHEITDGIKNIQEGYERLMRYAFPTLVSTASGDYLPTKVRLMGYCVHQGVPARGDFAFYAPWYEPNGLHLYTLFVQCNIYETDTSGVFASNFLVYFYGPTK